MTIESATETKNHDAIAIIGVSGRFPGAPDVDQFWKNQMEMSKVTKILNDDEMLANGATKEKLARKDHVSIQASIKNLDCFDAPFFNITPAEAELMDPQLRLLMEVGCSTLENAGYVPSETDERIGAFACANLSTYWLHNLAGRYQNIDPNELLHLVSTNSIDYLATTLAYRLGLNGPALNIQTACSSGLSVVATACQHLLDGSCDAALALAASLTLPGGVGYFSTADSIFSPDGICRPFDENANGTFVGDGVCAVMLKRLEDAQVDRDRILGVIRGWAINNDGHRKIGFFAPSAEGQQEVMIDAAAAADVTLGDLDYIETHGTGTRLGDPIEFQAINAVHGRPLKNGRKIAISSVKSSIGHLGPASGLAGLIRTVLALKNNQMPGTLHFNNLNPVIKTDNSQLHVLKTSQPFPALDRPARAGVSSFGIGGTNVHMILEADELQSEDDVIVNTETVEVLPLSGVDQDALERNRTAMLTWLTSGEKPATEYEFPTLNRITDSAMYHRKSFPYRLAVTGKTRKELIAALSQPINKTTLQPVPDYPNICFVFTGSGVPSGSHAKTLAKQFPAFKAALSEIDNQLLQMGNSAVSEWLFQDKVTGAERNLSQSHLGAFAFGYANARLWQSMGLTPSVLIGHSMGEIAAACIGGSISLVDALAFVIDRALAIENFAHEGELIAVSLESETLISHLKLYPKLSISGYNGIGQSLVAGPRDDIDRFAELLRGQNIPLFMLPAGRPFHSQHMIGTCAPVAHAAQGKFKVPKIPFASTVTGTFEDIKITEPDYWATQIVTPVNLTAAINTALTSGCTLFLELGPRPTFSAGGIKTLYEKNANARWISALNVPAKSDVLDIDVVVAQTRTRLYEAGFRTKAPHRKKASFATLPGYSFARIRHWRDDHINISSGDDQPSSLSEATNPSYANHEDHAPEDAETLLRTILATIWSHELGLSNIPSDASFVSLGGTSLTALKVIGEIDSQIGLRPPLTSLINANSFTDFVVTIIGLLVDAEEFDKHTNHEQILETIT